MLLDVRKFRNKVFGKRRFDLLVVTCFLQRLLEIAKKMFGYKFFSDSRVIFAHVLAVCNSAAIQDAQICSIVLLSFIQKNSAN